MKGQRRSLFTFFSSPDGICAPVTGRSISLQHVPDEVFSQQILGAGMAFRPDSGVLYAPVSGIISRILMNGQVIWLEGKQGMTFLLQIGLRPDESRDLQVEVLVKKGDSVKVGTELARFSLEPLLQMHDDGLVVMVVTSVPSKKEVVAVAPDFVIGGRDQVLRLD